MCTLTFYFFQGTHWLLEAVSMIMRKSTDYLRKDHADENYLDGMPFIDFIEPDELKNFKSPRLLVTHLCPELLPEHFQGKIIHLSRNPKDTAVSLHAYFKKFKPVNYKGTFDTFLPQFLEGKGKHMTYKKRLLLNMNTIINRISLTLLTIYAYMLGTEPASIILNKRK